MDLVTLSLKHTCLSSTIRTLSLRSGMQCQKRASLSKVLSKALQTTFDFFRAVTRKGPDSECKLVLIVFSISLNICFECSKGPSHRDGSFEHPQHMFWLRNKKIIWNHFSDLEARLVQSHRSFH